MQYSALVRVIDRARDLGHEPRTFVGPIAPTGGGGAQAPATRELHAVKGQPFLALPDLVNRQDVRMIELRHRLRFAPETDQVSGDSA